MRKPHQPCHETHTAVRRGIRKEHLLDSGLVGFSAVTTGEWNAIEY